MVDLPTIPNRVPTVRAPEPKVSRADVVSPYMDLAGAQDTAAREAGAIAIIAAKEAGAQAVTRDEQGNVRIEKAPIVGDAAIFYKRAIETAAVADGEQVIRADMATMRREFENDPEGFRKAADTYTREKVVQYRPAGAHVANALGRIATDHAIDSYNGLLNQKERRDLVAAKNSIEAQILSTENELFALANGGDTTSSEVQSRLQKIGALYGELSNNPRFGVSKDRVDYELSQLRAQVDVASLDYRVAQTQKEKGTEAAIAEAERVRVDPSLNLTPAQRFTYHSRLVAGVERRARIDAAVDRGLADQISEIGKLASEGYAVPPERMAATRAVVEQSKNPNLITALDAVEAAAPTVADWRKSSPARLEQNLAELDRAMREGGATPDMVALHNTGDKLLKTMREQIKVDPLGWADRTGAVPVPPIDFAAKNVVDQIRERVGRAEIVANHYGVAPAYFRPDERAVLSQVASQGGDAMIGLSRLVVEGAGDRAPRALSEIGKDAPVLAHIGGLMTSAGSPAVMRDAAEAVALRRNPDFKHPRWLASQSDTIQAEQHNRTVDVYGGAFALAPDTGRAAEMTAQDAFFTRSARTGYDPKLENSESRRTFDRTLQEAAGAVHAPDGTQFGGVAEYKPGWWTSYKVLIPSNIRADRFGAVMGALRDEDVAGAVAADGKRYTLQDIRAAVPVASRGGYRFALGDPLSDDPKWIRGADGRPFVLDIGRIEPVLRQRVPDAFAR